MANWFYNNGDDFNNTNGVVNYWGIVDLISGQGSPTGSTNVWRWTFLPTPGSGGQGMGNVFLPSPVSGTREMWVKWYWKYSSGFQYNGIMNKQFYFDPSNTMGMGIGPNDGITSAPQGPSGNQHWPNQNASVGGDQLWYVHQTGQWHKFKAYYNLGTNSYNGTYRAWVDDVLIADYSGNIAYDATLQDSITLQGMVVIYGGGSGDVPQTQYLYIAGVTLAYTDPDSGGADTQAPTVPTGLSASAVSSTQINLSWTASTDNVGVTGYKVFRNSSQIGTSGSTSFSDTGLSPSTLYSYTVAAYDASGNTSAQSTSASATTQAAASSPGTVNDLSVSVVSSSVLSITFTQVDDGTGQPAKYDVRISSPTISWGSASSVSQGTASTPLIGTSIGSSMTKTITGLLPSTQYQVQMIAYRGTLNVNAVYGSLSNIATATTASVGSEINTYSSSFDLTENPISEGSVWYNGGVDGLDWNNVMTANGRAFGVPTSPTPQYADPTAILKGSWNPDQAVEVVVFSQNPTNLLYEEVEIRLRNAISPNVITGYEIDARCRRGNSDSYLQIAKWPGPLPTDISQFTYLFNQSGSQWGVQNGDVLRAQVVGDTINVWLNNVLVVSVVDPNPILVGNPGIGFNYGQGSSNVDSGINSVVATSLGNFVYTDNFNRTNEATLVGNWTTPINGDSYISLSNNAVVRVGSYNAYAFRNSELYKANHYSQIKLSSVVGATGVGGPTVRSQMNGSDWNGYFAAVNNSGIQIYAVYGSPSSASVVGSIISGTFSQNDIIGLNITSNILSVYKNGNLLATRTDTNNRISTSGSPGLYLDSDSSGVILDEWSGSNYVPTGFVNLKTVNGIVGSSIKSFNGLLTANVKTFNGLSK